MILNGELYTARRFTERILSLETGSLGIDEKIEIQRGDQILILDNSWDKLPSYLPYFEKSQIVSGKSVQSSMIFYRRSTGMVSKGLLAVFSQYFAVNLPME